MYGTFNRVYRVWPILYYPGGPLLALSSGSSRIYRKSTDKILCEVCSLSPFYEPKLQIKPHPTRSHYPLMTYLRNSNYQWFYLNFNGLTFWMTNSSCKILPKSLHPSLFKTAILCSKQRLVHRLVNIFIFPWVISYQTLMRWVATRHRAIFSGRCGRLLSSATYHLQRDGHHLQRV